MTDLNKSATQKEDSVPDDVDFLSLNLFLNNYNEIYKREAKSLTMEYEKVNSGQNLTLPRRKFSTGFIKAVFEKDSRLDLSFISTMI